MPFVLKDGDILGYWINSEYTEDEIARDDFSTDEDIVAQEKIKALKLVTEGQGKKGKGEKDLTINGGF